MVSIKEYGKRVGLLYKYRIYILALGYFILLQYLLSEYHPADFFFIFTISLSVFYACYKVIEQHKTKKLGDESVTNILLIVIGIIALQAAWPVFMPRIALEDVNQIRGVFYADKNQHQIIQEAVIRVKPPLFPLIMNRNYPIANNLKLDNYISPNLEIVDSGNKRDITVILKRITGWSFDEITGKIIYQTDKPFITPYFGNTNITNIDKIPKLQEYELYPYNYRYSFYVENINNFPIEIYNLSFSVYNDTTAWKDLKKWTDGGFCAIPFYGWNYSSSWWAEINGEEGTLISRKIFNSINISIQIHYLPLAPHETKNPNIIFKETVCGDDVKDNSSYTSYIISGTVTSYKVIPYREDANYFIILVRNINTTKLGSTYAFPNTPYKYDLASLPGGYDQGDVIQIKVCENVQNCTESKNITVDVTKGYDEVNFNIK